MWYRPVLSDPAKIHTQKRASSNKTNPWPRPTLPEKSELQSTELQNSLCWKGSLEVIYSNPQVYTRSQPCSVDTALGLPSLCKKLMNECLIIVLRLWLMTSHPSVSAYSGPGFGDCEHTQSPHCRTAERTDLLQEKALVQTTARSV